jgi:hypothetical protein
MHTLHIEHAVTDFDTWRAAFDRFAGKRGASGVVGERVRPARVFTRPDDAPTTW